MIEWIHVSQGLPKMSGTYWVHIKIEDEYEEGHLLYSGGEYQTHMQVTVYVPDESHESVEGIGIQDEQWHDVVAWLNFKLPKYYGDAYF